MFYIFKLLISSWLISMMIKNCKKAILIIALFSGYISNIASNPTKFIKNTEKKISSFSHTVATKSCNFIQNNPSLLGIKVHTPKACKKRSSK